LAFRGRPRCLGRGSGLRLSAVGNAGASNSVGGKESVGSTIFEALARFDFGTSNVSGGSVAFLFARLLGFVAMLGQGLGIVTAGPVSSDAAVPL